MPEETNQEEVFRCPCCGMVAPAERLAEIDASYEFEQTTRRWGGSRPLTDEELESRFSYGRGSAPGIISYDDWRPPADNVRAAFVLRLRAVVTKLIG